MIKVCRITHAQFDTPDIEAQIDHYMRVMGMTLVDRDQDSAYLTTGADHHTIVLRRSSSAACHALGFQLPAGAELAAYAKQVEALGVKTERLSDSQPNIPDVLAFEDTKGTRMEVFVDAAPSGVGLRGLGVSPNKLGHVAFNVQDVNTAVKFYCDVLGFKVSDWMGDFFAFLRCGPDHHSINLLAGGTDKMNHVAFELRDWAHIKDSNDLLAQDRIPLVWGPVRHGIGHNISTYHLNPDKQVIELFCELDQVNEALECYEPRRHHQEYPQRGKVWTDLQLAADMWGSRPPAEMLD